MEILDLDNVEFVGPPALTLLQRWNARCAEFRQKNPSLLLGYIPDEQARIDEDGGLTIFVKLGDQEISMRAAEPDEWRMTAAAKKGAH